MAFVHRAHKYHVGGKEGRSLDGFVFDSKAEMEYYLFLTKTLASAFEYQDHVLHVDVHPKVTLGPGDRVEVDFLVWYEDGRVEFIDVKSTIPHRLAEFKRLQKRWRHPGGPLIGIIRKGKQWQRIEDPPS